MTNTLSISVGENQIKLVLVISAILKREKMQTNAKERWRDTSKTKAQKWGTTHSSITSPISRLYTNSFIREVERAVPSGSTILDVGAGGGALAIPLYDKGYVVIPEKPYPACPEYIRRVLSRSPRRRY
jgi:hypothetical protein